jgi:hypothetical protein
MLLSCAFLTSGVAFGQQNASAQPGSDASTDPFLSMPVEQTVATIRSLIPNTVTVHVFGKTEINQTLSSQNGSVIFTKVWRFLDTGRSARQVDIVALKDLDWNGVGTTLQDHYYYVQVNCKQTDPRYTALTACMNTTSDHDTKHEEYQGRTFEINFGDPDSTLRAAMAIKHLIVLDGTARGVAVNIPPLPPEDFAKGPLPDVVAILKAAEAQKIVLSKDDYRKLFETAPDEVKKANRNDYADHGGGINGAPAASVFAHISQSALGTNDPRIELAYQRACALPYNEAYYTNFCADLGKYYESRGDRRMALAVYTIAPKCRNETHVNALLGPPCLSAAARLYDMAGEQAEATRVYGEICTTYAMSCQEFNRRGGHVDLAAAKAQQQTNIQEQKAERQQETEDRAERARATDARFNAVLGTLQGLPGGSDPNAILNAGAQQAAALRAIGDANAARQQQNMQVRLASQALVQTTGQARNSVAGPATASQGSAQVVTSSAGAQSNVDHSNSAIQYSTPLATSCVRQFFDPNTYNWLSFENNCGQAIYVMIIFHRPGGWAMTEGLHLAPGNHNNTGLSSGEINQAGGFDIYVCPTDSVPVDLSGSVLNANVAEYRCKPQ